MNKKRKYIVNLLTSAIYAFLLSYCLFEKSILTTVCLFVVILTLSFTNKNKTQELRTKTKFLFIGLVILGLILILLGKFVFNSDMLIIIGAMLFSIIAPLILMVLKKWIMKIHILREKGGKNNLKEEDTN